MFSRWFRKSGRSKAPSNGSVVYFPQNDAEYAEFVAGMINAAEPGSRAMCVVAHVNLQPTLQALENVGKRDGFKPFHFDEALLDMHRRLEEVAEDPIKARRFGWFVMAMHVKRLDQVAARDPAFIEHAVGIWLQLADAGKYISKGLESNIVWTAEEKAFFEMTKTEQDGTHYVLTMEMPRAYRLHPRVKEFANLHDCWLLP